MAYNGLKVELTDGKGSPGGIKNTIGTLLINNLIIQDKNPSEGQPLREGLIAFGRDNKKGFVNYLWNALFTGVKSSIGVPDVQDIKDKRDERKKKRDERKEKREEKKAE
jgi:hypothetical protein